MNKTLKMIIVIVLVLAIIVAGFLYYNKIQEDKMGFVSFENIKEEIINGKVNIGNKEFGLNFIVPDKWKVFKDSEGVVISSPDFVPMSNESFIPHAGCSINVNIEMVGGEGYISEYDDLVLMINDEDYLRSLNADKIKYETIELSGLKGIKNQFFIANFNNNQGEVVVVSIPYSDKIYYFETDALGEDKERCIQEFNNFLNLVSIKNK